MKSCFIVLALAFLTGGCSFPCVGSFPQSNEVFDGEITTNPFTGHADVKARTHVNGVAGRGYGQVTHTPYNTLTHRDDSNGQRGIIEISCDDGRLIKGKFVTDTLTSGYGWGQDQFGNPIRFTFGMKRQDVPAMVRAELAKAAKRPSLAQPTAPTTTPAPVPEVQE
jgi:hypothetical protein